MTAAPYTPIVGTLGYVLSEDRERVLMIHRDRGPDDHHFGKYNGLGGKLERDEDVVSCLRREIREEAGITCERLRLAGTISWPGFGPEGEDWLGFIFLVDSFSGKVKARSLEGRLCWVPRASLLELTMWAGDRHFLPLVFADPLVPFHGVMPYRDGRPLDWSFTLL